MSQNIHCATLCHHLPATLYQSDLSALVLRAYSAQRYFVNS
jgi:hypothetical protein